MALLYLALSKGGAGGGISGPFNLYFSIDFFICLFSVCLLVDRRLKVSFSSGITYLMPNFLQRLWRFFSCSEKEFAPPIFFYVLLKNWDALIFCYLNWKMSFQLFVYSCRFFCRTWWWVMICWQFYFVLNLNSIGMLRGKVFFTTLLWRGLFHIYMLFFIHNISRIGKLSL